MKTRSLNSISTSACPAYKVRTQQIADNRKMLLPMIKTVIFCGRFNLPFRGHSESIEFPDVDHQCPRGDGVFRGLIHFRMEAEVLRSHLQTVRARNALYLSSDIY